MKKIFQTLSVITLLSILGHSLNVFAQGTTFTYQGRLNNNGAPANGSYDLAFTLYSTNATGVPVAAPVTNSAVAVTNGLFTTLVDFGNVFNGASNWLEIAVSTNTANNFITLAPRQQITPTPYTIYSANAGNATTAASANSVLAGNISGPLSLAQLPGTVVTNGASGVNISGTFSGNGAGVTNVSVNSLVTPIINNSIIAWGNNAYGQTTIPAGLTNVTAAAAGGNFSLALKSDKTVVAWGDNTYGETNIPAGLNNVTAVAAGNVFAVALKNDGTVVAWGNNSSGQTNVPAGLNNVTAVAAGNAFTVALKNDGTVVAWGGNSFGQTNVPAGLNNVTAVAAGNAFALALKKDGTVVAWGDNSFGQTNVPAGLTNVTAVAAGATFAVALKNDGTVVAWGDNSYGETNIPVGLNSVIALAPGWAAYDVLVVQQQPFSPVALLNANNSFNGNIQISGNLTANGSLALGGNITSGGSITANGVRLNDQPLYLRSGSDINHALAYNGGSVTNFGTGQYQVDGPALWGYSGGLLGVRNGGDTAILQWTATGVMVNGTLSGNGSGLTNLDASQLTSIGNNNGGSENFFLGSAGNATSSGQNNTANGVGALVDITTGPRNTANGFDALENNTSGGDNTANGSGALENNTTGRSNTANGNEALENNTTGGGNTANGNQALQNNTTGGNNTADGNSALFNNTTGANNIALGYQAGHNITTGSNNIDIGNQGVSSDTNIIRIGIQGTQTATYLAGTVYANGVALTSDRNAKENFIAVNARAVLAKVVSLPVTEWNYKSDRKDVQHLGPMAQDFQAAFGLDGADDKHISVVDEGGVALAAIQGLNQKLNEKDVEIQTLKQQLMELQAEVKVIAEKK